MVRMGRMERANHFATAYRYGTFHDLIRLRSLVVLLYYADKRATKQIGFVDVEQRSRFADKPPEVRPGPEPVPPPRQSPSEVFDVCVIGSGAGGAVVAARLAEMGQKVALLEEGPHLVGSKISRDITTMQATAYRDGGLVTSRDFDLSVLQGRCVGGSTFLNNGICFEAPNKILRNWGRLGCDLDRGELAAAYQRVRKDIGAWSLSTRSELPESGATRFMDGCRKLGKPATWFDVNLGDCAGCGYCTSGCYLGRKQSTDLSYVPRLIKAGGSMFPETRAVRIEHQGSKATSVLCSTQSGESIQVRAKKIVVSCGAIHSSLLLQRSGIGKNVGTRVSFNVGSWVFGEFREPVDSFDGVQMCAYHEEHRFFAETMAMPPAVFAASMPSWFEDHFDNMLRYRYFALAGAMVGTQPVGEIRPSRLPLVRSLISPLKFKLPISDLRKLRIGVREVSRIWLSSGALRVLPATTTKTEFTDVNQLDRLEDLVVEAEDLSFGSAHPQGGNPMSDDPKIGAVDTRFRVHGFENLFVADASIFPTSVSVNPQLAIMALADLAATRIAEA